MAFFSSPRDSFPGPRHGLRSVGRIVGIATCAGVLVSAVTTSASAIARSDPYTVANPYSVKVRHGMKTVTYLGRDFVVPSFWRVVDLTAHPSTCVRFDVHAVYLGRPGTAQRCPARGIGRRTGALLIEPDLTRSTSSAVIALDRRIAAEIDATAPGVTITASYGADRATVIDALTGAGLPQPAEVPTVRAVPAPSAASTARAPLVASTRTRARDSAAARFDRAHRNVAPTRARDTVPVEIVRGTNQVTGLGFDTCAAPSAKQMDAWTVSPFTTVGIYIGGSERACGQQNLTSDWVAARAKAGWHFMPIYVGWQAAWDPLTATASSPGPAALGTQSADDAIAQARRLGIGPGALLYYDMESYRTRAQCTAAMAFLSAWTAELHARGYRSAVYSSASTGIADLVANRGKITEPDVVAIAHWNGIADADLAATPADAWPTQRVHQYLGNVYASYGGVRLNIDKDYLSINNTSCPNTTASTIPEPGRQASNRLVAC